MKGFGLTYKQVLADMRLNDRLALVVEKSREGSNITSFIPGLEGKLFLIHAPEMIKEVLGKQHEIFVEDKHPYLHIGPIFGTVGRAALLLDRQGRPDAPANSTALQEVASRTESYADFLRQKLPEGGNVDIFPILACLSIEIMTKAVFDFELGELAEEFFLASMQHEDSLALSRRGTPNSPEFGEFQAHARTAMLRQEEIIGVILKAKTENGLPELNLPPRMPATRAMVRTLLNAYAGTATTLSWVCCLLAQNPEWQEKVRKEAEGSLGAQTSDRMPVIEGVIRETLRLYPTAWMMSRSAVSQTALGEDSIPKGAVVFICTYSLHRDEKYWSSPESFSPDRFFGTELGGAPPYAYLPFGAGLHRCPGAAFAMNTIRTVLGTLIQRFHFSPVPAITPRPFPRVALQPEPGAWIKLTPR